MAKKTTWIYVGLGLIILSILLFLPTKTKDKDFLEVRFYDTNGNLISSTETFATICQGATCSASGVVSMGFDMNVRNTGNVPLNFNIQSVTQSVTGSEANTAFATRLVNNIAAGATHTFSSSVFTIPASWIGQSITFTGTVGATVTSTGVALPSQSGTPLTLVFNADPSGSFTVTSFTYRTGSGTATTTLPTGGGNVRFRTTSTSYTFSLANPGAIAYTSSCGSTLTRYGYTTGGGTTGSTYTCTTGMPSELGCSGDFQLLLTNLPGDIISGGVKPSLWQCSTDSTLVGICETDTDGLGYVYRQFDSDDPDAALVSTSPTTINSALEVSC